MVTRRKVTSASGLENMTGVLTQVVFASRWSDKYQLLTSSMISFAAFPWSFFYDSTEKIFASDCLPRGNLQRCRV